MDRRTAGMSSRTGPRLQKAAANLGDGSLPRRSALRVLTRDDEAEI